MCGRRVWRAPSAIRQLAAAREGQLLAWVCELRKPVPIDFKQ